VAPGAAERATDAIVGAMLDREATMLAHNDVSWVFAGLFLIGVPLIFLIPRRETSKQAGTTREAAATSGRSDEASPAAESA
jgi:hypothetical protein